MPINEEWKRAGWLAVVYLAFLEATSWLFRTSPSCLVNAQDYGSYYAKHQECPTFHVFLIEFGARILEIFGKPEWVVAIFTVVLAFATYFLWRATVRLVEVAEKTAERQLRAYLFFNNATIFVENNQVSVVLEVKNAGQTPAYDVVSALQIAVTDDGAFGFEVSDPAIVSRGSVGPGGIRHPRHNLTFDDPKHFDALQAGKLSLFIYGRLKYRDAFDAPRFVNFRYRGIKGGKVWLAQPEQDGNDSN